MDPIEDKREKELYAKFQDWNLDHICDCINLFLFGFWGISKARKIGILELFLFLIIFDLLQISYEFIHPLTFKQFKFNEEKRQMEITLIKAYIYANWLKFIMIVFIIFTFIKSI